MVSRYFLWLGNKLIINNHRFTIYGFKNRFLFLILRVETYNTRVLKYYIWF